MFQCVRDASDLVGRFCCLAGAGQGRRKTGFLLLTRSVQRRWSPQSTIITTTTTSSSSTNCCRPVGPSVRLCCMDPGTHRHLYQPPATSSPLSLSPSGQASGLESAAVPPMPTQVSEQQQPGPAARPPGGELLKCHHCSLEFESISKRRTHMRTHQKQTTIRLRDAQGGTSVVRTPFHSYFSPAHVACPLSIEFPLGTLDVRPILPSIPSASLTLCLLL